MDDPVEVVQLLDGRDGGLAVPAVGGFGIGPQQVAGVLVPDLGDGPARQNVGHPCGVEGVVADNLPQGGIALAPGLEPLGLALIPLVVLDGVDHVRQRLLGQDVDPLLGHVRLPDLVVVPHPGTAVPA